MSALEKCLFRSSHFKIRLLVFLILSCMSSLYILGINFLLDMLFANIFFHSLCCLFVLLMVSFIYLFFSVQSFLVWLDPIFFFNWKIIALQYCAGSCHMATWVSHRYTYVPCLLSLPLMSRPIPPLTCYYHQQEETRWHCQQLDHLAHRVHSLLATGAAPLSSLPPCIQDLLLSSFPKVFPHSSLRSHHSLPITIKLLLTLSDTLPQSPYRLYPLPSVKIISTFVGTYYGSTLLPDIRISISCLLLCNKLLLNISSLSQPFITSQLLQVKNQAATYLVALAQGLSWDCIFQVAQW